MITTVCMVHVWVWVSMTMHVAWCTCGMVCMSHSIHYHGMQEPQSVCFMVCLCHGVHVSWCVSTMVCWRKGRLFISSYPASLDRRMFHTNSVHVPWCTCAMVCTCHGVCVCLCGIEERLSGMILSFTVDSEHQIQIVRLAGRAPLPTTIPWPNWVVLSDQSPIKQSLSCTGVYTWKCICVRVCVCVQNCMYVYVCVLCAHLYECLWVYKSVCVCMYVCVCI